MILTANILASISLVEQFVGHNVSTIYVSTTFKDLVVANVTRLTYSAFRVLALWCEANLTFDLV